MNSFTFYHVVLAREIEKIKLKRKCKSVRFPLPAGEGGVGVHLLFFDLI